MRNTRSAQRCIQAGKESDDLEVMLRFWRTQKRAEATQAIIRAETHDYEAKPFYQQFLDVVDEGRVPLRPREKRPYVRPLRKGFWKHDTSEPSVSMTRMVENGSLDWARTEEGIEWLRAARRTIPLKGVSKATRATTSVFAEQSESVADDVELDDDDEIDCETYADDEDSPFVSASVRGSSVGSTPRTGTPSTPSVWKQSPSTSKRQGTPATSVGTESSLQVPAGGKRKRQEFVFSTPTPAPRALPQVSESSGPTSRRGAAMKQPGLSFGAGKPKDGTT